MNEVQEIQITIEQARKCVARGEAIDALNKNRAFKTVILDGYFDEEAKRLVGLLAHPGMQSDKDQLEIQNQMKAIAYLQRFLFVEKMHAQNAAAALPQHEATLDEVLAEE